MKWDWDFIRGRRRDFPKHLHVGLDPAVKMVCINNFAHPMQEPDLSDMEVAGQVRMLHRNQLDHERVCTLARDRIVYLADRLGELEACEKQGLRDLPICCVSGRVAGDPHACGDCDPCGAAVLVPEVVKSLIKERDEWADKYAGAMMKLDAVTPSNPGRPEPVAWEVDRPGDPTFPRLYRSEREADAMVAFVNVNPPATKRALTYASAVSAEREALKELLRDLKQYVGVEWLDIDRKRMLERIDAALSSTDGRSAADAMIGEIEKRFPNWQSFRDLVDCIDCTLHDLRGVSDA